MTDLSALDMKQLIARHRYLTDRVTSLREKFEPLFAEYEKVRQEYIDIDTELARRQGLPVLEDKQE